MALLHINHTARNLGQNCDINVLLPECELMQKPKDFYAQKIEYPVIWLLHGTFGDYTSWLRMTTIEQYVNEYKVAVVMPSAGSGNYMNWDNYAMGYNWFTYFTEELMPMVYNWLPLSQKKEDNFIAGLSMGGRGATMFGLSYPQLFQQIYCMSAVPIDITKNDINSPFYKRTQNLIDACGGEEVYINSPFNLYQLLEKNKDSLPPMTFVCGDQDPICYENYKVFDAYAKKYYPEIECKEFPGYGHEWKFWNLMLDDMFHKFFRKGE